MASGIESREEDTVSLSASREAGFRHLQPLKVLSTLRQGGRSPVLPSNPPVMLFLKCGLLSGSEELTWN